MIFWKRFAIIRKSLRGNDSHGVAAQNSRGQACAAHGQRQPTKNRVSGDAKCCRHCPYGIPNDRNIEDSIIIPLGIFEKMPDASDRSAVTYRVTAGSGATCGLGGICDSTLEACHIATPVKSQSPRDKTRG
ncbi:MAG: hypothetical protein IJU35_08895 [Paludibacteraceae bacterium]|nr:hypothetical protein [Paludibacteraceae bacterium]